MKSYESSGANRISRHSFNDIALDDSLENLSEGSDDNDRDSPENDVVNSSSKRLPI